MNRLIPIIALLFVLYVQSYTQWQKTNFSSTVKINTLAISDSSIYAGTDGDGVFVSTDNGESWVSINDGLQSKVIYTIFINGKTILAGTETGAYASTNNGLNWNAINSGLPDNPVWSFTKSYITNSTQVGTTLFAGTWNGVYTSTNNGTNWNATGLNNTAMPVHSVVDYNNFVFAATFAGGIFCSIDNGITWRNISILDTNTTGAGIEQVHSMDCIGPNVIVGAGSYGDIYYLAYNNPFSNSGSNNFIDSKIPLEYVTILSFASRNASIFAGNSFGNIFISKTYGLSWKLISYSLESCSVFSLALNSSYIFAGTGNGIWRLWYPEATSNVDKIKETPSGFSLEQNYPNPFNSSTKIKFTIPYNSKVSLKVYNILGKLVDDLVDKYMAQGTYEVDFSAASLPSGIYFYSIVTNGFRSTKKLTLLK